MSEKINIHPRRFRVTTESTVRLYEVADSLLDLGASESAAAVGEGAFALHRAAEEIACVLQLLQHPRRNKRELRDWLEDMQRFGWGKDQTTFIGPWRPSPLERDAERVLSRAIEDVQTDVV